MDSKTKSPFKKFNGLSAAIDRLKQAYEAAHKNDTHNETQTNKRELMTLLLLAITTLLTLFTFGMFKLQLDIAKDTEQRDLRAYVTATDILVSVTVEKDGKNIQWHFMPKWQNAGRTPIRFANATLNCVSFDHSGKLYQTHSVGGGAVHNLGPGQASGYGWCTLTPQQIIANQGAGFANGVWSTIKYSDVFGNPHISEQCIEVYFPGDTARLSEPTKLDPNLQREISVCPIHNCEDEECKAS